MVPSIPYGGLCFIALGAFDLIVFASSQCRNDTTIGLGVALLKSRVVGELCALWIYTSAMPNESTSIKLISSLQLFHELPASVLHEILV